MRVIHLTPSLSVVMEQMLQFILLGNEGRNWLQNAVYRVPVLFLQWIIQLCG